MLSTTIGPLAISIGQLLFALALVVALFTGWVSARRPEERVAHLLLDALLVGLVVGRVAFVVGYFPQYQGNWLGMIDIRDGGLMPLWGLGGALAFLGWALWKVPSRQRALGRALAAGGLTWALATAGVAAIESTSRTLPEVDLATMNGDSMMLADYRGEPLVVNLWASWCPPCRREMPILEEAQEQRDGVTFVFANQRENVDTVRGYLDSEGLSLDNVVLDRRGSLGEAVGAAGLPTTLFYSSEGRLVDVHLGELSRATLREGLGKLDADD